MRPQRVPYGSLLKGVEPAKPKKLDMGRSPRVKDSKHLAAHGSAHVSSAARTHPERLRIFA